MNSISRAMWPWLLALSLIRSSSTLKCDRCHRTEKCTVKECPEPGKYGPFLCLSVGKRELSKGRGCILKRLMQKAFKSDDECREMNGIAALWLLAYEGDFGKDYIFKGRRSDHSFEYFLEFQNQLSKLEWNAVSVELDDKLARGTEQEYFQAVEERAGWFAYDDYSQGPGPGQGQAQPKPSQVQPSQVHIHVKREVNYPTCSCSQDSCNNNDWIDEQNGNSGIKAGGKKSKAGSLVAPGYHIMVIVLTFVGLVVGFGF